MAQKQRVGGGDRKKGRNLNDCKAYRASYRAEHNKVERLKKRLERHPNDAVAKEAMERLKATYRGT